MPYVARKSRGKSGGYVIVNKQTGEVKGRSSTKASAAASARARNAAAHGWQPSGKAGKSSSAPTGKRASRGL